MTGQLIVDDEYIRQQASCLNAGLSELNSVIDRYITCLDNISAHSVREGATADALRVYTGYAKQLQDHLEAIGANVSCLSDSYLTAIDDADQYFY